MVPTSALDRVFSTTRAENRAALVGYLTAFDPDRAGSLARAVAACEAGLDVLELGLPFSDPSADGPDVEGAMVRALQAGATALGVLDLAREIRRRVATPIVLFSYANPLLALGDNPADKLCEAGVDGVLVLDLPPESAGFLRDPVRAAGLDWISLVAPTTDEARLPAVTAAASGFIYAVSLKGVTGTALASSDEQLARTVSRIRAHRDLPIAVGFGIRTPETAARVAATADAVVVGSALVKAGQAGVSELIQLVEQLRGAVERPQ